MDSQGPKADNLLGRIRRRAHQLWQAAGEPDGQRERFYREAEEQELAERQPAELGAADPADDPAQFGGF